MNLTLLLVDDDRVLVDQLARKIDWDELHIEVVLTAYNIHQAKELMEDCSIDLMICDIDMPGGSGLELLEWMREEGKDTACIFLTSYANFSYVQKALRLSSLNYILKPISLENLKAQIKDNIGELRQKLESRDRDGFDRDSFGSFLKGQRTEEELYISLRHKITVLTAKTAEGMYFTLLSIRVYVNGMEDRNSEQIYESQIARYFQETYGQSFLAIGREKEYSWTVILMSSEDKELYSAAEIRVLSEWIESHFTNRMTVFISRRGALEEIVAITDELRLLRTQNIAGMNQIALYGNRLIKEADIQALPWKKWQNQLKLNSNEASVIAEELEAELKVLYNRFQLGQRGIHRCTHELYNLVSEFLTLRGKNFDEVFNQEEYEQKEAEAFYSLKNLIDFVHWVMKIIEGNEGRDDDMVSILKAYIDEHLDEDLSRKVLANQVYISEDYMARLFMKETGLTLANYITKKRIEKAMEYLKMPDIKISRIALMVGYNNFSYFSKSFRELTGSTPNEYRAQVLKNVKNS